MNSLDLIKQSYYKCDKNVTKYFILCNSSCDMDSFLSAVLLAIARNFIGNVFVLQNSDNINDAITEIKFNQKSQKFFVPLINCKRGELKTRLDINFILKTFQIDEDILFYINDQEIVNDVFSFEQRQIKIILVDHNKLDDHKEFLSDYVEEIFDHHNDNTGIIYKNLKNKTIQYPTGSCSSLILLNYYISNSFVNSNFDKLIHPLMAITAILIDTNNFKSELYNNRWVDLDYFVFDSILNKFPEMKMEIKEFFVKVEQAKHDEFANLELGVENLMKKDKKSYVMGDFHVEWSSFQIPLKSFIKRWGWDNITKFFKINTKDFYVTISFYDDSDNKKIVIIYDSKDILENKTFENLKEFLTNQFGDKFKYARKKKDNKKIVKLFFDNTLSRKLLEPCLKSYLEII